MARLEKVGGWLRERGALWTVLYGFHWGLTRVVHLLERALIGIETKRFLTSHGTISSSRHTAQENRRIWNTYDWSQRGEEWTAAAKSYKGLDPEQWKQSLVDSMMRKHMPRGATVLEIGPGGGRWTETLVAIAGRLIVADISEKCLAICRERFRGQPHVTYHLIGDEGLAFLDTDSLDAVWSYDVFVHINPNDIDAYLRELRRVLRPGGAAVIHHSGTYRTEMEASLSYRSHIDGAFFSHLLGRYGFEIVEQNTSLPHKPGDVISVFRKPARVAAATS